MSRPQAAPEVSVSLAQIGALNPGFAIHRSRDHGTKVTEDGLLAKTGAAFGPSTMNAWYKVVPTEERLRTPAGRDRVDAQLPVISSHPNVLANSAEFVCSMVK